MKDNYGVHISHCCKWHGCKYGDDDCPVVTGKVEQKYLCEDCYEDLDNEAYIRQTLNNYESHIRQTLNNIEEMKQFMERNT